MKIYVVSSYSCEPYEDYGETPEKAFTTREAAEKFLQQNKGVFNEGYFKYSETDEDVPCDRDDEDALYQYGWSYSPFVREIELV